MSRPLAATLLAALLALAGCAHEHDRHAKHRGPPPHAPAHGHRHHHAGHGIDLRYDAHVAAYVVIGHPHHFFHDGRYYRRIGSHWERCGNWKKGQWKRVELGLVPVTLARHYKVKGPKHGKRKVHGHGPAKHDD